MTSSSREFRFDRQIHQYRKSVASGFISKRFEGKLSMQWAAADDAFLSGLRAVSSEIQALYEAREFPVKALRAVMEQATSLTLCRRQQTLGIGETRKVAKRSCKKFNRLLEAFRILTICRKPVLLNLAAGVGPVNIAPLQWADDQSCLWPINTWSTHMCI